MSTLCRIPVVWDGLPGLPGLSVFYSTSSGVVTTVVALKALFTATAGNHVAGLTWSFPTEGDTFDDATGELNGFWNGGAGGTVTSTGASVPYASGCGYRIVWSTGGIVAGRHVRGSTFMIPLIASLYDTSGTLSNTLVTNMTSAAATFVTNGDTLIWHRPDSGGSNGSSHPVLAASVPDKVSTLRSRRV